MSFIKNIYSKYKIVSHVHSSGKPVPVDCMFSDIHDPAHKTHAPDTFYVDFGKLPQGVKKLFEKAEPEIDSSGYTVHEPTAFLRVSVLTKDKAELSMEIHLGKLSKEDEDDGDEDEDFENQASEMKATFDWRLGDVYFEVGEYPEDEEV